MSAKKTAAPKCPDFEPVLSLELVNKLESQYNETWGITRRMMLLTLTHSGEQLVQGLVIPSDLSVAYSELAYIIEAIDAYCKHLSASLDLAETARARLIAAGKFLSSTQGDVALMKSLAGLEVAP